MIHKGVGIWKKLLQSQVGAYKLDKIACDKTVCLRNKRWIQGGGLGGWSPHLEF